MAKPKGSAKSKKAAKSVTADYSRYPKPGAAGGRLIRDVISILRAGDITLPIDAHILIATSGGIDSIALAHLLVKYGRRVVGPKGVSLLHINHGWRGKESDSDAQFVRACGKAWGVKVHTVKLKPPKVGSGESWEDVARQARKAVYERLAEKLGAVIFTAHHADDLAETLLWRLFTGSAQSHGGGIALWHGVEIRPFLRTRKAVLKDYLKEEGLEWREDRTNHEGRFLRARMRQDLMPQVERLFPRAVEHLVAQALRAQESARQADATMIASSNAQSRTLEADAQRDALHALFGAAGLKPRRYHWDVLAKALQDDHLWEGELHLPGGWRLICRRPSSRSQGSQSGTCSRESRQWVLRKI